MNFTNYMNTRIYASVIHEGDRVMAIGEKKGQFDTAFTVDIEGADLVADLNHDLLHEKVTQRFDVIRAGEILEHLVMDYQVLRSLHTILADDGRLLVTVPFDGIADYHVRLHNRWSIEQLLHAAGFRVETYIPRKAPRWDRFIAYLRGGLALIGIPKEKVNAWFFSLNPHLPIAPNGGYFVCRKAEAWDVSGHNREEFLAAKQGL